MFPPGPYGHPITGNLKDLKSRVLDFFCSLQPSYGDISTIRFSVRKVIYLQHPDLIQYVLQENNRNFTKSLRYEQLKYLLGNGLLTSEGDEWLKQRRLIQPAFHKNQLALLADEMITCTHQMLEKWKPGIINVSAEMTALTLDIVSRTLLNADVKSDAKNVGDALSYLLRSVNIRTRTPVLLPLWIPLPSHLKIKSAIRTINATLDKVFEQRRNHPTSRHDLLSMLMETRYEDTGKGMSDKQLRDEVMTLFVAGHETTANALSWTLHLLASHPQIIEKCRKEIQEIIGHEKINFKHLSHLKYLNLVIEESMRLYPPAWIIGRKTKTADTIGGYAIPAGTNILISPYAMHRDKRFWVNPEQFKPERFMDEQPIKFTYLPFGAGPRMCIGNNFAIMEMQIVLAAILQRWSPGLLKEQNVVPEPLITLRPKGGLIMQLKEIG